jgi:hypothetical protein
LPVGRLTHPLLKLPLRLCADTLQREVSSLPEEAWTQHPQKFDGNIAVALVSPGGQITDSATGPMGATKWLNNCPYILEIMRSLGCTWGRSRLMGLQPGAVVPEHVDIHYYWRTHLRLHIPVVTNPEVAFTCAGETIHMQAGECWLLDSFYRHSVVNGGSDTRIHLVLDTVGGGRLWDLLRSAAAGEPAVDVLKPGATPKKPVEYEHINSPTIMSHWELKSHLGYIKEWTDDQPGREEVFSICDRFMMDWEASWARYGASPDGVRVYVDHLEALRLAFEEFQGPLVRLRNRVPFDVAIGGLILANAIAPGMLRRPNAAASSSRMSATR